MSLMGATDEQTRPLDRAALRKLRVVAQLCDLMGERELVPARSQSGLNLELVRPAGLFAATPLTLRARRWRDGSDSLREPVEPCLLFVAGSNTCQIYQ